MNAGAQALPLAGQYGLALEEAVALEGLGRSRLQDQNRGDAIPFLQAKPVMIDRLPAGLAATCRVLTRQEEHSRLRGREVLEMRRLRSSSEAEMVALFLRTELPAARFRDKLRALLNQAGLPERLITAPNLDDPTENQAREQLLTQHREYGTRAGLFEGFPDDVCWEWRAITPAELATVRYVDYDYWVELSGGTCLAADAAPRIRAGVAPFGVSSDWALGMAQAVASGARFPPLILMTTGPAGGLVVLEGHCRLTAYMLCPGSLPPELEVLVGSSPDAAGWGGL